jgi:hypothetical protein
MVAHQLGLDDRRPLRVHPLAPEHNHPEPDSKAANQQRSDE